MAEQRVVVEGHLGVEHPQVAVLHDDQRIDLEQAHVLLDEGLVERREQRLRRPSPASPVELQRRVRAPSTSSPVTPASGSIATVTIFSGVSCATASMSMPPSVETTKATRPTERSTSSDR